MTCCVVSPCPSFAKKKLSCDPRAVLSKRVRLFDLVVLGIQEHVVDIMIMMDDDSAKHAGRSINQSMTAAFIGIRIDY